MAYHDDVFQYVNASAICCDDFISYISSTNTMEEAKSRLTARYGATLNFATETRALKIF